MAALSVQNVTAKDSLVGIAFTTIDTLSTKLVSGLSLPAELAPGYYFKT